MAEQTCTARQLVEALSLLIERHGDLPVYAIDRDTQWRLPIGLMFEQGNPGKGLPERLEITTSYSGPPRGEIAPVEG